MNSAECALATSTHHERWRPPSNVVCRIGVGLLAVLSLFPTLALGFQDKTTASEFTRLISAARSGRAMIRPQAARRIVRLWENSAASDQEVILMGLQTEAGTTSESAARLGSALVEILGEFDDAQLRSLLWQCLADSEFPWRPQAARSLAAHPQPGEVARFLGALHDRIPQVRVAALFALGNCEGKAHVQAVSGALSDPAGAVRRSAADLLVRWGHRPALWYLHEELLRTDTFFDRPTGEQARFEAWGLIQSHLQGLAAPASFDPSLHPQTEPNASALTRLRQNLADLEAGPRPQLPPQAQAAGALPREVLGLELRSCRKGEVFLRWTDGDRLLVGQGNPAQVQLPTGTVAALVQLKAKTLSAMGTRRLIGQPGCDLEQFHYIEQGGATMWIVACGPDPIPDLRPDTLSSFGQALVATLSAIEQGPEANPLDARLVNLKQRTMDALEAIGGEL